MPRKPLNSAAHAFTQTAGSWLPDNQLINDQMASAYETTGKAPQGCRVYRWKDRFNPAGKIWCTQMHFREANRLVGFKLSAYQAHRLYLTAVWRFQARITESAFDVRLPADIESDQYITYLRRWEREWGLENIHKENQKRAALAGAIPEPYTITATQHKASLISAREAVLGLSRTATTLDALQSRLEALEIWS
jgi:hypothetical protein